MAAGEVFQRILKHLKKDGPLNTFRLARELNLDRYQLLSSIGKLEKAGAVEVQHGVVKFLKFVAEERKVEEPQPVEAKKPTQKPKKKTVKKKTIAPQLQAENQKLKERLLQLESKIKKLEQKASAPPKIIKKTIIKEVPAPFAPAPAPFPQKKKRKIRKKKLKKKEEKKKLKKKSKKFKFPKFKFMKNIKQLKKPEFAKK
ncbi:MAG: hypothetical protein AB1668_02185 [Nanoarchaeota archaeon]